MVLSLMKNRFNEVCVFSPDFTYQSRHYLVTKLTRRKYTIVISTVLDAVSVWGQ